MKTSHWIASTLILLLTTAAHAAEVTFSSPMEITTSASSARSVFAIDLDGDGDPDILSASYDDDKIAWYENRLNQAEQDFGSQQVITTSTIGARSVWAADLDGDGDVDVLSASSGDNKIAWYENRLNQAEHDFGTRQIIASGMNFTLVHAVDVDGDGDADIIANRNAWCENRLNQTEHAFGTLKKPSSNAVDFADLDCDGDIDFLGFSVADTTDWIRTCFYGFCYWTSYRDIYLRRIFNSGSSFHTDNTGPYIYRQSTTFSGPAAVPPTEDPSKYFSNPRIFATDLNGDSYIDVAAFDDGFYWIEDGESVRFFSNLTYPSDFVDLNNNGNKDILTLTGWHENRLNQPENDFGEQQTIIPGSYTRSVYPVDLDGDKDLDIVYAQSNGVYVIFNQLDPFETVIGEGSTSWYFADGDNQGGAQTYILVNNTNTEATTLTLKALFYQQEPVTINATAEALSRCTIAMHEWLPGIGINTTSFGCELISNLPVFAERVMYTPEIALRDGIATTTFRTRATAAIGAREPRTEWFLAEGATGAGAGGQLRETYIYIANPNETDAMIELEFLREDAAPLTLPYAVEAQRRRAIDCAVIVGLEQANFSTRVRSTNGVGIVVDRTMVGAADGLPRQWAHAALAADRATTGWWFGDGSLTDGCETFLTLANPSSATATVNLRFLRESEEPFAAQVAVAPLARETVILSTYAELLGRRFSIEALVADGGPGIVAERPMYWRAEGYTHRSGASDTIGATHTAATWFLPEGAVFGQSDFECEFAVGNPSTSDTLVEVAFMLSNGEVLLVERELAAGRRITISANDHLANTGGTISFSTLIRTTNGVGIVADRSMYARSLPSEGGIARFSGHASQAISLEE
ncbi:VCBS repeat-containing protein [Candidatus Sumerlaeota bacterium]|nr:VCBS repeat-containing protein [Candidatus Sumerlaeota bacterium]